MKRRKILVIIVVLVILSLAIPYFASTDVEQYIGNVSTLVTLFATLLTLVIAMILYNQIGLDQMLLQRKAEVVFQLLDLLNARGFTVKTNVGYKFFIFLSNISKYKEGYDRFGDFRVLFNRDYLEYIQPIIELEKNVFLPKELFGKILALEPHLFQSEMAKVEDSKYVKVHVGDQMLEEPKIYKDMSPDIWGSVILKGDGRNLKGDITVKEFIDRWDDLIISSVDWINKFSSYQELNIPFLRDYYSSTTK